MKRKAVVPRARATQDVEDAIAHYLAEADEKIALGFVDALERAFERIARHPALGSPRYAHELKLPGLRAVLLERYPYAVFYVEHDEHVDVWRVLHTKRDVPERVGE